MAACLTLQGYTKGCDNSVGGIKKIWIVERAGLTFSGVTSGEIKKLEIADTYTGYTYDFLRDNSNVTEPIIGDGVLANVHWQPNITLVFRKMSNSLRNEIYELSKGLLCAIVQDFNDIYWFYGYYRGLQLVASAGGQTGNKLEELNGYTILLQSDEPQLAYTIDISATSSVNDRILAAFGF